jgi:uncharacterized SAM-binding protein YcdF (DUF218 family)
MPFVVMKTMLLLILPPSSLLILMAVGLLTIKKNPMLGKLFIASGLILLYLVSINPVTDALLKPLETSSSPWKDGHVQADAIVVLGGGVRDLSWMGRTSQPSSSSVERLVMGITLYQRLHIPLVLMGGNGDPSRTVISDADAMAHTALNLGVNMDEVIIENKSRNTLESAGALKSIIKGKKIVLVTSASHMKRAAAIFSKQGFHVVTAPSGYDYEKKNISFFSFIPRASNLHVSSTALHEYLSFFWYWTSGDT